MTRVWLTPWEWECCGDPFEVGDAVDFGIRSRDPSELVDEVGAELVATLDALESHHEEEYTDRVRGTVVAVLEVTREVVERRFEYFVEPFARARPSDRLRLPDGVSAGARFPREGVRIEPVPDTIRLASVEGAPLPFVGHAAPSVRPDGHRRRRVGWVVDVEDVLPALESPEWSYPGPKCDHLRDSK